MSHDQQPSALQELNKRYPLIGFTPSAFIIATLILGALVWSLFAELEEVSVATGVVIPQGKVKVVQHFEGGIINDIYVQEGDIVRTDARLIQLDLGAAGVNQEELEVKLDGLYLKRARLMSEATDTPINIPAEIADNRPELTEAALLAHAASFKSLKTRLEVLEDRRKQKQLQVQEYQAELRSTRNNLNLTQQRFAMSTDLLRDQLTSRMDHLELESVVQKLQGELETLQQSIPRAQAAVKEAENNIQEERNLFQREALEDLSVVEQDIAQTLELLSKATDQGLRALVRSPIDGVVTNLTYNTIGGVVGGGEPIMEIVPISENLVVEAQLNPMDRGYVDAGQRASVKINTYDFIRYGSLEGYVLSVAPDATTQQDGNSFFRVIIQTDKTYLGDIEGQNAITPGMGATVDIHTGKKTVMDYLLKPVLKMKHEAFRER